MQPHGDRLDMPALPSATVVLLRDGPGGLEVFLLERHGDSDVLGGAYVFPGGKVDREDAELAGQLDLAADALQDALAEPALAAEAAAAIHVAAIRELFEETGVLLARVPVAEAEAAWARLRSGLRFPELAEQAGWQLEATAIAPWSRWITPLVGGVIRKRFDTRFFVATMPAGQQARHDEHEAVAGLWTAPREALRRYWDGLMPLAPPQIMTLAHLSRHASVAEAVAEARGRQPPLVQPEPFDQDGARVLCYPGDPRHSIARRALPGPTRLAWRGTRFEPEGGFDALFG